MDLTINKVAAGVVGLAMVAGLAFAFTATRVHATTLSELVELFIALEVIAPDKADEARAALDNMATTPATPGATMSCNFTRSLTQGDTGADVMDLQKLLNLKGFTVSVSGAGSPGQETEYYGPATAGAVAKMQEAYASEILTPLGLSAGTGYFGASTRAKANALCAVSTPDVPAVPGDDDDEDMDDDDLEGGEASLEDFDALSSIGDEELDEGEEDAEVYGFTFDVEDADVKVSRIDIRVENNTNDEDPWDVFETVSLWYDGEMIAEEDADAKSDWGNETGDAWSMRFSGLDVVVREGDTAEFIVAVSVGNIDDGDLPMEWSIWVENNGVRAIDAAGINQYIGDADALTDADHEETFEIDVAGGDTEGNISTASANPSSSIIKVNENSRSDEVAVLVMDYESEDGETTLNKIVIFATTSDTDLIDVINDVTLDIDGDTFTDWYYSDTATGTATTDPNESGYIVFDLEDEDDEYTVDTDDEVEIKVIIEFKQQSGNYDEGTTIELDVNSTAVEGWLVDDVNGDDLGADLGGTANGEAHQLLTQGIFAEIVSIDETSKSDGTNDDAVGEFKFKLDVTAFDDTFYMSATSSAIVAYTVYDADGASTTVKALASAALSSTATKEGSSYRIDEGDTETFTFTVSFDAPVQGYYYVTLDSITYGDTAALPYGETHTAAPTADFESDNLLLNV